MVGLRSLRKKTQTHTTRHTTKNEQSNRHKQTKTDNNNKFIENKHNQTTKHNKHKNEQTQKSETQRRNKHKSQTHTTKTRIQIKTKRNTIPTKQKQNNTTTSTQFQTISQAFCRRRMQNIAKSLGMQERAKRQLPKGNFEALFKCAEANLKNCFKVTFCMFSLMTCL